MVVVHLLAVRKSVKDQLCSFLCLKLVGMMFGPRFHWLPIGCRWSLDHQDYQKTTLGFFLTRFTSQSEGVVGLFRLEITLIGQLLPGSRGTPHNEF